MMLRCILAGALALGVCAHALHAAPVSFADLARHPQYRDVRISPDGQYIAASAVVKGQMVLALVHLSDLKGVVVHQRAQADVIGFWWASPNRVIYMEGVHENDYDVPLANGELYAVDADGRHATLLYGYGSGLPYRGAAQLIATIPDDPLHVLVTVDNDVSATKDGLLPLVEKMDVRYGSMDKVVASPIRNPVFIADHKGHIRLAWGEDEDGNVKDYRLDATGWQPMPEFGAARDMPIGFNNDDTLAYFDCNVASGFGICAWNPSTGEMKPVWTSHRVDATGLMQGSAEDRFMGVAFEDGRPGIALFDSNSEDAKLLIGLMQQFPGESVGFVSATRDGSKAIVKVDSDTDPGTFYLYDRATHKLKPLLRNAAWIKPAQMASKQPFEFAARDGLKLQGYLSYPPGQESAKHLPMVVYVHGGPYGVRDDWDYDPDVQAMATRGYVVMQVNYRGSGGYGYDFEKAGWLQWGGKMQDDITDATRWAIAQGIADPARICIYGGSYGGYAALEGAVKEPDLYKCAIGYVGVYDLSLMYRRGDIPQTNYGKKYLARVLGTDNALLAQHSPINQLDRLKAKVMLIVGGKDERVPPIQGQNMHDALKHKGIAHEWLYKRKETHGFYSEENLTELYTKVDAFLNANIGPGAAGSGVSASAAASH